MNTIMERMIAITSRLAAAADCGQVKIEIVSLDHKSVRPVETLLANAPSDINFLIRLLNEMAAENKAQVEQLSRIKAALLAAGCSDYTDDVARMAEEFLADERREAPHERAQLEAVGRDS